ncbi:MAG: hypothetical protein ACK48U_16790 [Planctomyces sp.]|jgi:hypothetical protein
MKTTANNQNATDLRNALKALSPEAFQEIREAYYKAMEGLNNLAQALEQHAGTSETDPLLREHMIAANSLSGMDLSQLGRIV